jgi:hypothetical protein
MKTWFFAALAGVLWGQAAVSPQQTNDGVIEITVRDAVTKAPVPGARVRFIAYRTPTPNVLTDITADENGRVVFKDLASGNYDVDAQKEGYVRPLLPPLNQAGSAEQCIPTSNSVERTADSLGAEQCRSHYRLSHEC